METWPTTQFFIATRCNFYLEKNRGFFISPLAKTIQTVDRPGKRWRANYDFEGNKEWGQTIEALLDKGDTFGLWDMVRPAPFNGVITGVTTLNSELRGATTIEVIGLPIAQTHLKAGDYVGISGKLYRLTDDVASDTGGEGTLSLNRGLLGNVSSGVTVNTDRPICEMLLEDDNAVSRDVDGNQWYRFTLPFIEAISAA